MIGLIVLALILIAFVVGGFAMLIMRENIPLSDTQRRADFDRKAKDVMIIGGAIAGAALTAAARSDRRQSATFARSWDLDNSQFEARRAAQQTADYNRSVAAYNKQVALNNQWSAINNQWPPVYPAQVHPYIQPVFESPMKTPNYSHRGEDYRLTMGVAE